ncbi:MAG: hypothetical protein JJT78_07845 [Leptospira sp.]|nr:hypothetical protein [Leptospira sp.]
MIQESEYKTVLTFYRKIQRTKNSYFLALLILFILILPNLAFTNPQNLQTSYIPPKTEEIHIYFHCRGVDFLQKETIRNFLSQKKEKLEQEGGKVFFLPLGKGDSPEEPVTFSFNSGSFLWIRPVHLPQSQNNQKYKILFGYNPNPYSESVLENLDREVFWVFDEELPNSFRRLGNTHALACPKLENKLGKLKLVFRGNRLIRKHFSYSDLENWLGDL